MEIIRGTTPIYTVSFATSAINVSDIEKAVLTVSWRGIKVDLSDGLVFNPDANTISYHFSQEETLSFKQPLIDRKYILLQMDVIVDGERFRATDNKIKVVDTLKSEVI